MKQRDYRRANDTLLLSALLAVLACSDEASRANPGDPPGPELPGDMASPSNDPPVTGSPSNAGVGAPPANQAGGAVMEAPTDLPLAEPPATPANPGGMPGEPTTPERTLAAPNGFARNPIVSHIFTADPSAHVFEGRVYVYTSHDLDNQAGYDMNDYHAFSSADLVNWQDHGVVLAAADIGWTDRLYAPTAAYSAATGKYYLYFPNAGSAIGVAVSDSPAGPFVDVLGRPLIDPNVPGAGDVDWLFDPMAFVDDDGQAYLYFGGGPEGTGDNARVIRLNPDMISLADAAATTIPAPDLFEASYVHKHDGRYYFSYSTSFANHAAFIDYLVSDNPMTGWQYTGTVLQQPDQNNGNNNHHSIIEYEGNSYIFYHNRVLANREGKSSFQRSITLDNLTYDAQGNINLVPSQKGVVRQLRSVDAFARIEAEAIADQRGIETDFAVDGGSRVGVSVTELQNGDWIGYSQVDFAEGASTFRARVAPRSGGVLQVRVDGCNEFTSSPGVEVGSCPIGAGAQAWTDVECAVTIGAGVHDLCLSFSGDPGAQVFDLDYFSFE
jgi:arabinoxylan arabinofuranohydrolase